MKKMLLLCAVLASGHALAQATMTLGSDALACKSRDALKDLLSYRDNQEDHLFKAELIGQNARCAILERGERIVVVESDPASGIAVVRRLNSPLKLYAPMGKPK